MELFFVFMSEVFTTINPLPLFPYPGDLQHDTEGGVDNNLSEAVRNRTICSHRRLYQAHKVLYVFSPFLFLLNACACKYPIFAVPKIRKISSIFEKYLVPECLAWWKRRNWG